MESLIMKKKYDSRQIYAYLVTTTIIMVVIVVGVELLVSHLMDAVLYPALGSAISAAGFGKFNGGIRDMLRLLAAIASGHGSDYLRNRMAESKAVLLVLAIFLLYVLPIAVGIFVYARLVSEKIRMLTEQIEEEHRAYDRKRNLLISDMAHDLRTPMTTVAGYAQALSDGMVPPEKRQEYLQAIVAKTGRMSEMISSLFEYAKLGSEGFRMHREPLDLRELLLRCAADVYTDMEQAGMRFEVDIPDDPIPVSGDATQLSRVFTNLLVNAMRHNPKDTRVVLRVRRQAAVAQIVVIDDGVKIPEETDIFEPFVKADASRSADAGSGLGLSIAAMIIGMHGWRITLEQPYPDYTKAFVVQLPV